MLPYTTVGISLRIPPTLDGEWSAAVMKKLLEENPPYNAEVNFKIRDYCSGWASPEAEAWLKDSVGEASQNFFGREAMNKGEGASIPLMNLLGELFGWPQFLVTGVLGPGSNAHGPDEFLDLPTAQKVAMCVAQVLAAHGGLAR
jgi:acetylornithine deacetylase/succinyl-diaminopimelate desuccinylase-like protein